jgi:hypothetical protein
MFRIFNVYCREFLRDLYPALPLLHLQRNIVADAIRVCIIDCHSIAELTEINFDSLFSKLHGDPRWSAFMKKMGFEK